MREKKFHNNLYGIFFMTINGIALAVLYLLVKELRADLDSGVIVFLYKGLSFILVLPWVFSKGIDVIYTPDFKLHLYRGFLSTMGALCWGYGIKYIYVANATAIIQMEQVLWVLVGVLFFDEVLTRTKIFVVLVAILGVFLVLFAKDGGISFDNINWYYMSIFAAVGFYTLNSTVIKILGQKARNKTQMFYAMFFSTIFAYPFAMIEWSEISLWGLTLVKPVALISFSDLGLKEWHMIYVGALALCYFIHALAFFLSLRYGDLSVVMPFFYTKLIASVIIGSLVLGEKLSELSLVGIYLIFFAGVVLIRYENRKKRSKKIHLAAAQAKEAELKSR